MVDGGDVDLVADIGMPDRFTIYTSYITFMLSLTWAFAAIPAMIPAYIAPTSLTNPNGTEIMPEFYSVIKEFKLDPGSAELATTVYFIGSLVLGQIPCALSDKYGRHPILFLSALTTGLSGIFAALAPTYPLFLVGRFFQGAAFTATTNVNWVMVCESVPLSKHGLASFVFGLMWVCGYCIISPLAILFPTWRLLFMVTSVPMLLYSFVARSTIRESLAYLILRKRRREVDEWISHMESWGQVKFEGGCLDQLLAEDNESDSPSNGSYSPSSEVVHEDSPLLPRTSPPHRSSQGALEPSPSIWAMTKDAVSDSTTALHLAISIYMWITDFLVYNGLSLSSTGLNVGNPHVNYVFSGLVEVPATILLPIMMDKWGRRPTVIFTHALTSITLFAMCFISEEAGSIYTIVWLVAKFGTASSFIALYIYGSEIFHVKYRNICLGICCTLGNLGAIAAPYSGRAASNRPWVIFLTYASVSGVSSILDIFLPETLHKKHGRDRRIAPEDFAE